MIVRRPRILALLLGLLLVAAACGQKSGVHVATSANGSSGDSTGFTSDTGAGTGTADAGTGDATSAGGATSGGGTASAAGGTKAGGSTGAAAGSSGGAVKVIGTTRTGVTNDKITIAVHAPVTGAAPLPATSFEKARDLYWRWITEAKGQKVLGRSKVEVLFKDDRYQPSTAVQACRELSASAFLLVGGGGTDQIQACGRFAESSHVPYFSGGVTENGLQGLKWYYAASMTYKQQGGLLAAYVKKTFPGKKVAAVITDTPNFDDAAAGWEAGEKAQGLNYYKTLRHPRADTSWYNTFASELKGAGVEVLYINSSPVDYIRFAQQASQQGFKPQYVGVGITMGLNPVLESGCPEVDKGTFFSPFPGLDWARQNEPDFFAAASKFGIAADDLGLALWGFAKDVNELFKRYEATYGKDLTREDFRNMVEQQKGVHSGVFPDLSYSASDHFGSNQVHVLQADCGTKQYKTLAAFATGF
ncbi:MAG: branched-chain amino acid transport system substrate-binding protein [Actinomycetota bacterium]